MKKHITAEDLIKAQGTISCQKELKEKLMLTETLEEAVKFGAKLQKKQLEIYNKQF